MGMGILNHRCYHGVYVCVVGVAVVAVDSCDARSRAGMRCSCSARLTKNANDTRNGMKVVPSKQGMLNDTVGSMAAHLLCCCTCAELVHQ
jgi:hypothetical protein